MRKLRITLVLEDNIFLGNIFLAGAEHETPQSFDSTSRL